MNNPRIMAFGLALGATGLALFLLKGMSNPVQEVKEVTLVEAQVLVASKFMPLGSKVSADNLQWKGWPKDATQGLMTRISNPNAMDEMMGRVVRKEIDIGDPIRTKNLVKSDQGGVMAAILPAGMRAITLSVESAASDSGLILPNDHVDVIFTSSSGRGRKERSETLMKNIRVLAIGPEFDVKEGEKVLTGRKSASLELKPHQVESITQAKRKGIIWLSLRSIRDVNASVAVVEEEEVDSAHRTITVTRFGHKEIMDNVNER